jgi:hypothetical protein
VSAPRQAAPSDRAARRLILWVMAVGVAFSGVAFAYKLAGFIWAVSSPDFRGTFDVGITVYFFVSAGWACLLVWCWLTGKFSDMERAKVEMLQQEEDYERHGI